MAKWRKNEKKERRWFGQTITTLKDLPIPGWRLHMIKSKHGRQTQDKPELV